MTLILRSSEGRDTIYYIFTNGDGRNILNHWCGSTDICMKQDLDRNFTVKVIRSQSIIYAKQEYFFFDVRPNLVNIG